MVRLFIIILFSFSLVSCKMVNVLSIDYLQPAEVTFPASVKSILVVDNTLKEEENKMQKEWETEEEEIIKKEFGVVNCDSKILIENFSQHIATANYFDEIIICDSALRENDHFVRETKLSRQEVEWLTTNFQVDAILALEYAKMYIEKKIFYYADYPITQYSLDASIAVTMRAYLPGRMEPMVSITNRDSIFWVVNNRTVNDKILREGSEFAASLPVNYFIPNWKNTERLYYASGSMEFRDANVAIKENSWDEALELWMKANNKKSDKIKMRSSFNIALYYELNDKLEDAKVWAEKAFTLANKKQKKDENGKILYPTEDYLITSLYFLSLEERLEQKMKLELQMERFNDNF